MLLPNSLIFQDPPTQNGNEVTTSQDPVLGESIEAPSEGAPVKEKESAGFDPTLFLVIGALFWFLILGPERKNRKKRQAMLDALSKGDEVMTTGGLFGRVSKVDEQEVILVVADGVRLRFSRGAVQGLRGEEEEADKKEEDSSKKG